MAGAVSAPAELAVPGDVAGSWSFDWGITFRWLTVSGECVKFLVVIAETSLGPALQEVLLAQMCEMVSAG
jgi:hypothetical protein